MAEDRRYTKRLDAAIVDIADSSNAEWVQYIKDHRSTLMDSIINLKIEPEIMNTYRYRLRALLEHHNYSPKLDWIVMWLNSLTTTADVVNLTRLLVPDFQVVQNLFRQYQTYSKKLAS